MTDDLKIAQQYLSPPLDSYWQWVERGRVLSWADGKTITFREELCNVLGHFESTGLPPLGAVALLLAATRDNWHETSSELGTLLGIQARFKPMETSKELVGEVVQLLDRVSSLPAELRHPVDAKATLAELVFQDCTHRIPPPAATRVVEELAQPWTDEKRSGEGDWTAVVEAALIDLKILLAGLKRVDADTLRLRLKTGLDRLPQPAAVDLPPAERIRALLKTLEKDDQLCGLAKLAQNLMAAVTLPRTVSDREEMQVGGVSDITNRGPLDRLLLSELVHDDLTLAVRVAVNEAMYLRRESPPRTPPRQRAVFLEAGIRSWGVPRLFATAIALALAATTEQNIEVVAYRAKGSHVEQVDLTTRAGLVAHLAALEPELHPGRAFGAFENEMAKAENTAEPVLITTEDVLDDKQFQQLFLEQIDSPWHVATVNRDGRFRLLERALRGSKLLREARLNLEELFAEPKRNLTNLVNPKWTRDLPAIFSVVPFPLLLSQNVDMKRLWSVKERGILSLTKDRRLLHWTNSNQGARQLAETIPKGALWWSSHDAFAEKACAVVGHLAPNGLHLLQVDLDQGHCEVQSLDVDRGVHGFCAHNGVLFAVYPDHVQVVDLASGEKIQDFRLPENIAWRRDRFFSALPSGCWYALSFDGKIARLESVVHEDARRCPKLLMLFAQEGVDGPLGITTRGDIYSTATSELRRVRHNLSQPEVRAIAPDGSKIVLGETEGTSSVCARQTVIDVETLTFYERYSDPMKLVEPNLSIPRSRNVRNRFLYISVDSRGAITLTSHKRRRFAIEYNSSADRIILKQKNSKNSGSEKQYTFKKTTTPPEIGFRLTVATWDDGSEAFLDSRGLLHLRSSDRSLAEISIVLTDGELSGWCSDGRLWGNSYFIGKQKSVSKRDVFESVIQPIAQRLS